MIRFWWLAPKSSQSKETGMESCNSCGDRPAVLTVTASKEDGTVLDVMHICFECTEEEVIELLPGCKDAK